jgi:hypothetical protein
MSLFRLAGIGAAAMLLAPIVRAASVPECEAGTLAHYEALPNGCALGTGYTFTFSDFTFQILSASSSEPASEIAAAINVTPVFSPDRQLSLSFSSPFFSASSGQSVKYLIGYTEDPPPPEIIRVSSALNTDPPVYPGMAKVTTDLCVYAAFNDGDCPGTLFTLTVSDNGISSHLFDQTPDFSPVATILGVQDTISLDASTGGSASFTSFEDGTSITGIPEPASVWLLASAGMLLLLVRRVRAKSS